MKALPLLHVAVPSLSLSPIPALRLDPMAASQRSSRLAREMNTTFHSAHSTVHTSRCTRHGAHFTVHTLRCTLHGAHFTVHISRCTLHGAHFMVYISRCIFHGIHFTVYISWRTFPGVHFMNTTTQKAVNSTRLPHLGTFFPWLPGDSSSFPGTPPRLLC